MLVSKRELDYVAWQNRATRFYVAARSCYLNDIFAPAAFCGFLALELMLKATLIYHHHPKFDPKLLGHSVAKLTRMLHNRIPTAKSIQVPAYFVFEQRYFTTTRYASGGKGVLVPSSFLPDLDATFAALVQLTPFQHNTELKQLLSGRTSPQRKALTKYNRQLRTLRSFLGTRPRGPRATGA